MLTLGVSAAEVQQALTLLLAIVFILLGSLRSLPRDERIVPVQASFMDSLLFFKQLKVVLFNLAVPTAFIVFVPVVGLLMYAALASTLQTFFSFFAGVIAPVMCTITVAV